jgi:hypothetical protein
VLPARSDGGLLSRYITLTTVTRVLLADGWHQVADDSFSVEPCQFRSSAGNAVSGLGEPVATWTEARPRQNSTHPHLVSLAVPAIQILAIEYEERGSAAP